MAANQTFKQAALKNILWIGLLTGTLDALAAIILTLNAKMNLLITIEVIFKFIASGLFGKAAFAGGAEMVTAGVIFHYLIAYLFTTVFYLFYPFFSSIFKNKYTTGFIYGFAAWIIMNLLVVPLSQIGMHPLKFINILKGVAALVICVGLPVALIADKHLKKHSN